LVVLSPFDQIEKLKSFSEGEILSQRQTQWSDRCWIPYYKVDTEDS
jgi:hypothetical protein